MITMAWAYTYAAAGSFKDEVGLSKFKKPQMPASQGSSCDGGAAGGQSHRGSPLDPGTEEVGGEENSVRSWQRIVKKEILVLARPVRLSMRVQREVPGT